MSKSIWWALVALLVVLAGFMLYMTLVHPDMPLRGFLIVAALLLIAGYPLSKAREVGTPSKSEPTRQDGAKPGAP